MDNHTNQGSSDDSSQITLPSVRGQGWYEEASSAVGTYRTQASASASGVSTAPSSHPSSRTQQPAYAGSAVATTSLRHPMQVQADRISHRFNALMTDGHDLRPIGPAEGADRAQLIDEARKLRKQYPDADFGPALNDDLELENKFFRGPQSHGGASA